MDIQAEKISLAQLLLQTEDESIIKKVKAIFKKEEKDWWNDLSEEQKKDIDLGLESFPVSNFRKTIRKCVISKQTTIFYKIRKNDIVIVSLFDTRQNPDKTNTIR